MTALLKPMSDQPALMASVQLHGTRMTHAVSIKSEPVLTGPGTS